jgi:sortase A
MTTSNKNSGSNAAVIGLVVVGLLVVVFSFSKSLVDLVNAPILIIDLVEDDQIEAGFLPVYVEEDVQADALSVAVNFEDADPVEATPEATPYVGQAFPTAVSGEEQAAVEPVITGLTPDRIVIPAIELDESIVPVEFIEYEYEGRIYNQWVPPEGRNVGWHNTTAGLGIAGNTVLNGHHNIKGMVFRDLYQVQVGDTIELISGGESFSYVVVHTDILEERNQPIEVRLSNAEWIKSTEDERVTIITCWPFESNTHRVVVVAVPIRNELASR